MSAKSSAARRVKPDNVPPPPVQRAPAAVTRVNKRLTPQEIARLAGKRGRTGPERAQRANTNEFTKAELQAFLKEDENVLPAVPDTKDWHYHWARTKILDKDDGANLNDKLNGRMAYELVTKDKLPKSVSLGPIAIRQGDYAGGFAYRDSVLLRCPMKNYKLAEAAAAYRTQQLADMVDEGAQARQIAGETRTSIFVEENVETGGIREEGGDTGDDE